jgi:hypothetical protein
MAALSKALQVATSVISILTIAWVATIFLSFVYAALAEVSFYYICYPISYAINYPGILLFGSIFFIYSSSRGFRVSKRHLKLDT